MELVSVLPFNVLDLMFVWITLVTSSMVLANKLLLPLEEIVMIMTVVQLSIFVLMVLVLEDLLFALLLLTLVKLGLATEILVSVRNSCCLETVVPMVTVVPPVMCASVVYVKEPQLMVVVIHANPLVLQSTHALLQLVFPTLVFKQLNLAKLIPLVLNMHATLPPDNANLDTLPICVTVITNVLNLIFVLREFVSEPVKRLVPLLLNVLLNNVIHLLVIVTFKLSLMVSLLVMIPTNVP